MKNGIPGSIQFGPGIFFEISERNFRHVWFFKGFTCEKEVLVKLKKLRGYEIGR